MGIDFHRVALGKIGKELLQLFFVQVEGENPANLSEVEDTGCAAARLSHPV